MRLHADTKVNADLRSPISLADAERLTGIGQQQVSRWRQLVADLAPVGR